MNEMLEERLAFIKAMQEKKSKKFVKVKFTQYCKTFSNYKKPDVKTIEEYKNTFMDYLRYMSRK